MESTQERPAHIVVTPDMDGHHPRRLHHEEDEEEAGASAAGSESPMAPGEADLVEAARAHFHRREFVHCRAFISVSFWVTGCFFLGSPARPWRGGSRSLAAGWGGDAKEGERVQKRVAKNFVPAPGMAACAAAERTNVGVGGRSKPGSSLFPSATAKSLKERGLGSRGGGLIFCASR